MSGEVPKHWTGAHPPTLSRLLGFLGEEKPELLVSRAFHAGAPHVVLTDRV